MTPLDIVARELAKAIHESWSHLLCGSPTPDQRAALERMRNPRPGQWVVELSTFYMIDGPIVGRFITKRVEPIEIPDWDTSEEPYPRYPVWYIETAHGTCARWWNAEFVATPAKQRRDDEPDDGAEWAAEAMKRHKLTS